MKSCLKSPEKTDKGKRKRTETTKHDIFSPVKSMTEDQGPDHPAEGCLLEQLRAYVVEKFANQGKELQDLQHAVVEKINSQDKTIDELQAKIASLDPLLPHARDLTVFAKVKNYITADVVDAKVEAVQQGLDMLKGQLDAFAVRLDEYLVSKGQLDSFAGRLDGYLVQQEALKEQFDGHVHNNFAIVERELNMIKKVVEDVGANQGSNVTEGAVRIQLGSVQARLEQSSERISQLGHEMGDVKGDVMRLNHHAKEQMDATNQHKCHCFHVDLVDQRLQAVEVTVNEHAARLIQAQGDPWASSLHQHAGKGRGQAPGAGSRTDTAGQAPPGFHRHGAGQGAGGGVPGGRAPDDDDDGSDEEYVVNEAFPNFDGVNLSRAFDDKVALNDKYAYDGLLGGAGWRKRVRGYWLSKCPELRPVLNWAEARGDQKIGFREIKQKAEEGFWMTEVDVRKANHAIWGFLGLCLKGEASKLYELAAELNGLDAWRLVVRNVQKGKSIQLGTLRRAVRNPESIRRLEDVSNGITKFETTLNEYKLAGGSTPNNDDLKSDLLDTLPQEIREQLLWHSTNPEISFEKFKSHIRNMANQILFHRGKTQPINGLDHRKGDYPETGEDYGDEFGEAIGAVMRRFGKGYGKGKGLGKGGRDKGGGKGNDWKLKCANCGGEHERRQCTEAEVPVSERLCHGCGEKGHISRNCPRRQQRFVKAVDEAPAATAPPGQNTSPVNFGCVDFADCSKSNADKARMGLPPGFSVPRKGAKPRPQGATLGDFVLTNSFHALQCPCDEHGRRGTTKAPRQVEVRTAGEISKMVTKKKGNEPNTEKNDEEILAPVEFAPLFRGSMGDQGSRRRRRRGKTTPSSGSMATSRTAASMDALASLPSTSNLDNTGGQGRPGSHGTAHAGDVSTEEMLIAPLEYADPEPGEIMTATRRVKMYVAADTGAVDHCVGPRDLPESVLVKKNPNQRGLIGAKGDGIDCYGFANVNLEQADGHMINSNVLVADVCRPLHSISKVCDNNHDMIFTKKGGVVVQAGVFDKLLATVKHVATYPRRGGLYVGEFDCIDPGECPDGAKPSGFAGQGASR